MVDRNAKDKATQAVREARQIDDALTKQGGNTITIQAPNTPEFWAGIHLLLQGEYTLFTASEPGYITLQRRQA